jgi:hypothetical protein
MIDFYQVFHFLLFSVIAGLVGTVGMTLVLNGITRTGITNAKMVEAVGSLFTKSRESAGRVGSILHIVSGVTFGILYTLIMIAPKEGLSPGMVVGFGIILGLIHGLMVCFFLVAMIAETHPLEEFRSAGFAVGLAHLVSHIIYGLLVGAVIAASGIASP